MDNPVERHLNKRINFTFSDERIELDLSQSLFSSFDVDAGSKLLLKTVAQRIDFSAVSTVADLGCGTGVLGICAMKKNPGVSCAFQDRDALALEFSRHNCALNGITGGVELFGGLAFQHIERGRFDLILSNLPAKAGIPVLRGMITDILHRLSDQAVNIEANRSGVGAIVVIKPLAGEIQNAIEDAGGEVVFGEEGAEHQVFHVHRSAAAENSEVSGSILDTYIRAKRVYRHGGVDYHLETAFNLPDFDSLGRTVTLSMEMVDRAEKARNAMPEGGTLFWNPGQGHAAVYLLKSSNDDYDGNFYLGSRDALQLEICGRNLANAGLGRMPTLLHVPSISAITDSVEPNSLRRVFLFPPAGNTTNWHKEVGKSVPKLLAIGGELIACASSTVIHRLLQKMGGMVLHGNRKHHGSRVVLLRKSS